VDAPDYAPSDALAHIGGDRGLIQGPHESDANFRIRLRYAWDDWARAGTFLELLVQLYWAEFSGAVIVQQNGLYYTLTGSLTAGVDPTANLTIGNLSSLIVPLTPFNVIAENHAGIIPANQQWFHFDGDTGFCSRFAIFFAQPLLNAFVTYGVATFSGTDTAALTWNNSFSDTTYQMSAPSVTMSSVDSVPAVNVDPTTKTLTGVTLVSSMAFTGSAEVVAWQLGANPFADLHLADIARLKLIVNRWRPKRATCMGVFAVVTGDTWDWPMSTWNGDSLAWDAASVASYSVMQG
jgi:hypothetical protein